MTDRAALGVLLDHVQDTVALLDDDGRITYVNAAVERTLGYDPADLVGEDAFEYIHADDREAVWEVFATTIDSDRFAETTAAYRFRGADGEWVWLESRLSNLTDSTLDGYVVSSRDVSDRVVAERDRRETATRLSELAAASDDVLWLFTGDWSETLFVNAAYESVYGQPTAALEADPTNFLDTVHPDNRQAVEAAMAALSTGRTVNMEYRVDPEHDYNTWVWVRGHPIREDGEVVRIAGFTRDITDRHRRERQLSVMDTLLRHNLRNDMNVVLGAADAIEGRVPEVAEETALIRRTATDLLESAEKERDIIDALVGDPGRTDLDLVPVVGQSVAAVRERFPAATIECSLPARAPVRAVEKVGLAVVELLENAVRHSEADEPVVAVSVRVGTDATALVVDDDCPPIPDNEAEVLRGDHEMSDVFHSTGLGLWLVYWCVEISDGRISIERAADAGNRVRVELPNGRR